jgi:hypothetical protein
MPTEAERLLLKVRRKESLLRLISDAYHRMATNDDEDYRARQRDKCNNWLVELTELYRETPELMWNWD